jgi:hypothetical protein
LYAKIGYIVYVKKAENQKAAVVRKNAYCQEGIHVFFQLVSVFWAPQFGCE